MSEKHLPYIGGNFDRIVFEGDGSTWVREQSGTRYAELFGTPEKAARTLHSGGTLVCRECLIREECAKTPEDGNCMIVHYDALLEWLRGEGES